MTELTIENAKDWLREVSIMHSAPRWYSAEKIAQRISNTFNGHCSLQMCLEAAVQTKISIRENKSVKTYPTEIRFGAQMK